MRPFSKLRSIAKNPRKIAMLIVLVITVLSSIIYCINHDKAGFTHSQNFTLPNDDAISDFDNDFARMNYVTKSIPSMKYRDFCAKVLTNVQDIECWSRFYRLELTKIGFHSFNLFDDHIKNLLKIARLHDEQQISLSEVEILFREEQDRYAQLLEEKVRNQLDAQ